jgi:1,6-anhydro-N-acetylmuramate kinase
MVQKNSDGILISGSLSQEPCLEVAPVRQYAAMPQKIDAHNWAFLSHMTICGRPKTQNSEVNPKP